MQLIFKNYSGKYNSLNGSSDFALRKLALCRNVMKVGYENRRDYLKASFFRHLELFLMAFDNVNENGGELTLDNYFYNLDKTEKVFISYELGQGLASAVAEKYFSVLWPTHYSKLKNKGYGFVKSKTKSTKYKNGYTEGKEPDLVGFDINGFPHVFEAKGVNGVQGKKVIQKAVNQASSVSAIEYHSVHSPFVTRNACIFDLSGNFSGEIIDPPSDGSSEPVSGAGLINAVFNTYSGFISERDALQSREFFRQTWLGYKFIIDGKEFFWGLMKEYSDFLREYASEIFSSENGSLGYNDMRKEADLDKRWLELVSAHTEQLAGLYNENGSGDLSIGPDGIILYCRNSSE